MQPAAKQQTPPLTSVPCVVPQLQLTLQKATTRRHNPDNSWMLPRLACCPHHPFPFTRQALRHEHGCHPIEGAARTHDRGAHVLGFKYLSNNQPKKMQHDQGAGAGHARFEAPHKDPVTSTCGHECLETPRWQHVLCLPSDNMVTMLAAKHAVRKHHDKTAAVPLADRLLLVKSV